MFDNPSTIDLLIMQGSLWLGGALIWWLHCRDVRRANRAIVRDRLFRLCRG